MTALIVLAFGAGLLAPVNPCGFALLPAYLASFLQSGTSQAPAPVLARLRRALATAAAIAAGFAVTVTAVGAALAEGLGKLIDVLPWVAALLGVVLGVTGVMMLLGRRILVPARARMGLPGTRPPAAAGAWIRRVAFGAGYAVAPASCTLAVLLSVASQALSAGTLTGAVGVFAAYAAGSAVLLLALAVAAALADTALSWVLGRLARHLPRISGGLLAASGFYFTAYWTPSLLRLGTAPANDPLAAISATAATWISAHQALVTAGSALAVITAVTGAVLAARRSRPGQPADCCVPGQLPTAARTDAAGKPETPSNWASPDDYRGGQLCGPQ